MYKADRNTPKAQRHNHETSNKFEQMKRQRVRYVVVMLAPQGKRAHDTRLHPPIYP